MTKEFFVSLGAGDRGGDDAVDQKTNGFEEL
jgi:hypothetical protein